MLRFLKWIFLVFGGLALSIMIFFYTQNKKDIGHALDFKDKLSYDELSETCQAQQLYLYPCFKDHYSNYTKLVGLTGLSIGLKFAFNFMDQDKENQKAYKGVEKDIRYSLNYLELNNLSIKESTERFHGFEFMYGGYLSSVRDYLASAREFSDGIFKGLESKDGIGKLNDPKLIKSYQEEYQALKADFEASIEKAQKINEARIEKVLAQAKKE